MRIMFLAALAWALIPVAGAAEFEIQEKDIAYVPDEIRIHAGDTIVLRNRDPFEHKTRVSRILPDGSPTILYKAAVEKEGAVRRFVFSKPGEYRLRCLLHDGMSATVKVE